MRPRRLLPLMTALLLAVAGCGEAAAPGARATAASSTPQHANHRRDQGTAQTAREAKRHTRKAAAPSAAARPVSVTAHPAATRTALAALDQLTVKGRAPKTGYSREKYGDGWIDTDGCDTRDRILTRDLTHKTYLDACRVASGTLADPYTAAAVRFARGGASEVDIDHVVPLSDAWQKGAQQWSPSTRV